MGVGLSIAASGLSQGIERRRDRRLDQNLAVNREVRAQDQHAMQMQNAQQEQAMQAQAMKHQQSMQRFLMSNGADTAAIEEVLNDLSPGGASVSREPDGSFTVKTAGGESKFENADELGQRMMVMFQPDVYFELLGAREKSAMDVARDEKKHSRSLELKDVEHQNRIAEKGLEHGFKMSEKASDRASRKPTVLEGEDGHFILNDQGVASPVVDSAGKQVKPSRTKSGTSSKLLQEADALAARMEPQPGEDADALWMRALAEAVELNAKSKGGKSKSPEEKAAEFESALLKQMLPEDIRDLDLSDLENIPEIKQAQAVAAQLADQYKQKLQGGGVQQGGATATHRYVPGQGLVPVQ